VNAYRVALIIALTVLLAILPVAGQETALPTTLDDLQAQIAVIATQEDTDLAQSQAENLYQRLADAQRIPFTENAQVAFLYFGRGRRVEWRGDFTRWDTEEWAQGTPIGETNLWVMYAEFPINARLDYKIVVNNAEWLLDPANPYQQVGGFGPNSELRMPEYLYPAETLVRDDVAPGTYTPDLLIESEILGYRLNYHVYTPAGYDDQEGLPAIYILDGHEYANPDMGSMTIVLDNLIGDARIEPVIAVFIDPRQPGNRTFNRRQIQFLENPDFARFIVEELLPTIDAEYRTDARPERRAILGTSFGGVASAYIGFNHPDSFHLIAVQSPAFWAAETLFDQVAESEGLPLRFFVTNGLPEWDSPDAADFLALLDEGDYAYTFIEVPEGHSWGNWRALLDDVLIDFFGVSD
jgi:enterochelin esterase family protein